MIDFWLPNKSLHFIPVSSLFPTVASITARWAFVTDSCPAFLVPIAQSLAFSTWLSRQPCLVNVFLSLPLGLLSILPALFPHCVTNTPGSVSSVPVHARTWWLPPSFLSRSSWPCHTKPLPCFHFLLLLLQEGAQSADTASPSLHTVQPTLFTD